MDVSCAVIPAGVVRVTGGDRVSFVHGQVSNDVRGLNVPGANRSLALNVRGQVEFDLRALRRADDLLLLTGPGLAPDAIARLRRYIVFDDVRLEDATGGWALLHVCGLDAGRIVSKLGYDVAGRAAQALAGFGDGALLVAGDRTGAPGFDAVVPFGAAGSLAVRLRELGAAEIQFGELMRRRVHGRRPDAHDDGFVGRLPQECGLDEAVSYRKGCYVGQEIMARLEARGNARHALASLTAAAPFERGSPVLSNEREVGQVGRPVTADGGWQALAVLRTDLPEDAALSAGGVPVEVVGQVRRS